MIERLLENIDSYIIEKLYELIFYLTEIISKAVLSSPHEYINSPYFSEIYTRIIKISILIGVPFTLFLTAYRILIKKNYKTEDLAVKLILFPIFTLLSPELIRRFIVIFNTIARMVINTKNMFIPEEFNQAALLALIIFMICYCYYMFQLLFFYAERNVKLLFFILLAPFIYLAWCIPENSHIINKWKKDISHLLLIQVLHALLLLLTSALVVGSSQVMPGLPGLVIQIGCLRCLNKADKWLLSCINSNISYTPKNKGKSIIRRVKGVIKRF